MSIEYPSHVSSHLKGNLDHFIRSSENLVIIEAKKADMERGFTQLAVELIGLDQYMEEDKEQIYGAVTVGDLWRFGILDRKEKRIFKDIDSFRVPADLEALFSVLMGILSGK